MKNVIKDIEQNCEDKSIKGIIDFLVLRQDLYYPSNYHREIWFFYKELRDDNTSHKEARALTMSHFRLNSSYFKRVIKKYKDNPFGNYVPKRSKKINP